MTDIKAAVAGERADLADVLTGLSEDDWDKPTLCAGWRVREVVAHVTMAYRYSTPQFLAGMVKARGNFDRFADRVARRDAATLTSADLIASVRDNLHHPWKPPGGGYEGALSHDVIHGLDITVALGINRQVPLDRLRIILATSSPRAIKYFGVDLTGIQLRATDLDWTHGTGTPLTGTAQDLLLVLCNRSLPPTHLSGAAADRFRAGGGV
ncbi:maleylpyruvate isomerase family mycothiol-dependent enzyme [Kribbella sp. NPDC055071]